MMGGRWNILPFVQKLQLMRTVLIEKRRKRRELSEDDIAVVHGPDGYVMYLKNAHGGPIISDTTYAECRRKFEEAFNLCEALVKMNHFKKHGNLDTTMLL
jgi:hypothetical protein